MKKTALLALIAILALGSTSAWAQSSGRLVIQPFAGYRTGGDFGLRADVVLPFSGVRITDDFAYGLSLGVRMNPNFTLEAQWARSAPTMEGISPIAGLPNTTLFRLYEDQFHANIIAYFGDNGIIRPFFVTGLGVTVANPRGVEGVNSETRFSWNLGLGLEKMFNEMVGLRLQAKWSSTYINEKAAWFVDWWGFAHVVPVSQYMPQWEFTGGLVFRF
jgi:opacity protein-like surface antigen